MSWDRHHSESERLASDAELTAKKGDHPRAIELYRLAAEAELRALNSLDPSKTRTLGVTAVSAAALYYKAGEHQTAKEVAQQWLDNNSIPIFASEQLRNVLEKISEDLGEKPVLAESNGGKAQVIPLLGSKDRKIISLAEKQDKVSVLERFFWFCAGAQVSVLSRPECTTERTKYSALGLITLANTALATLATWYAFFLVFKSVTTSIILALLSGVLIFSMNRFSYSFVKDTPSVKGKLIRGLARLPLIIILSVIIAYCLALKFFESEINRQIASDLNQVNSQMSAVAASEFEEINKLEANNDLLHRELQDREARRDQIFQQLIAEVKQGRTGTAGQGQVYRTLRSQLDELDEQRVRVTRSIDVNNSRISALKEMRDARRAELQRSTDYSPGLLARLEAFTKLSTIHRTINIAVWLLVLLFVALEFSPVLLQLVSVPGPYDAILKRVEREVLLREQRRMFELEMQSYIDIVGQ